MMKKRALFAVIAVVSLLVQGCKKEGDGKKKTETVTISVGLPEHKTSIDNNVIKWTSGDALSVFDDEPQFNRHFSLQSGADQTNAVFKGQARLTSLYNVVYPYREDASCSGNAVTIPSGLANTQAVPDGGGFALGIPAAGKVSLTGNSVLNNPVALIRFTIPQGQNQIHSVKFSAAPGSKMSGSYKLNFAGTVPVLSADNSGTLYNYVQTAYSSGAYSPGTYYLAVFPGTYSGCSVVVNGNDTRTIASSPSFAAGKVYDIGVMTYTGPAETRSLTVSFLPAETSTKESSGIPWICPSGTTRVAYCTNTDSGFSEADVSVNANGKLQFTASGLPKNSKQLWVVYPAQDNAGKTWNSKNVDAPASQKSNQYGDFFLDSYPFAIKVDLGQSDVLDFTYSLNGNNGDSRQESNSTIVKFNLGASLYQAAGYSEKFTGISCDGKSTTFNGANQYSHTSVILAIPKTNSSKSFSVNNPYQAGYTYASQTIDTSSGNIMSFEPQCSSRIVCVRSGDDIQTRLDACKPQKAYSKVTANDEMRIAAGTFTVASNILVRSGINVAGGYTATSTAPFTTQGANTLTKINGNNSVRCVYSAALGTATTWSNLELMNGAGAVNGAGIYINTNLNLSNCYIRNCTSSASGGGLYLEGGGGNTITGCTVENCSVTGDSSLGGGAVLGAACSFTGNTITGCSSAHRAGGIYATSSTGVSISGGSITGCTATNYGGGLFSNGNTAVSGTTISGCSGSIGGGVFMNTSGGNLTSCNISGNSTVSGRGGGLYLNSGTTATSCNIYGNTSAQHGGGVAGYNSGKLVNCTVYGNTATNHGGGVYWSGNTTVNANVIEGGTIGGTSLTAGQMNSAGSRGGGIYIDATAVQAKISGTTVRYNKSNDHGGGIYCQTGTISGGLITRNEAGGSGGGACIYNTEIAGTEISYNSATNTGGGLWIETNSIAHGSNRNSAAGHMKIHHNTSASNGGGAFIKGKLYYADVYQNTATGNGGGCYLMRTLSDRVLDTERKTAYGSLYNSTICNNTSAGNAGGVYMYGPTYMVFCKINGNKSSSTSRVGLGVTMYHQGDSYSNCAQLMSCTVCGNTCTGATQDANSAGIYINCTADDKYGYLYNTVSLNTGANYDITTSGYVDYGNIYGNAYRSGKWRKIGNGPYPMYNKEISASMSTIFVSTGTGIDAFKVKNGNVATYFNSVSSALSVSKYFPIARDYWYSAISGDVVEIGCQVKELQ